MPNYRIIEPPLGTRGNVHAKHLNRGIAPAHVPNTLNWCGDLMSSDLMKFTINIHAFFLTKEALMADRFRFLIRLAYQSGTIPIHRSTQKAV